MSRALSRVEWIEQKTIEADGDRKQVTFGVNDKSKLSVESLKDALPTKYRKDLAIIETH